MFKQADADRDGILSEAEFRDLMGSLGFQAGGETDSGPHLSPEFSASRVEEFLQIIDPYSNQKITFSECVHLLSSEMVTVPSPESV